ncbi:MAG: GIY-YIG nuclease family protein [Clostridia bacterium]|nr:GIY-YIG nuclease family protein [Clostridia bacterium]
MRDYVVYILRCGDGSLYTGVTTDMNRRLKAHNAGRGAKYTKSRLPVEPVWVERGFDRGGALRRELEIKSLSRAQKNELIKSSGNSVVCENKPDD